MKSHLEFNVSSIMPNVILQLADQIPQQANDANELPSELTNTSCANLRHSNEDCLLEIFSVKSLSLMNLCSLAETCTRFQQITQRVFPKDFEIYISREVNYRFSSRHYANSEDYRDDAFRILKNFGSILTEICIFNQCGSVPLNFVLKLVANYCVDSLDCLRIEGNYDFVDVKISEEVTVRLKPIFKRLQILELTDVEIVDDKTLFANFDSLIELSIYDVTNCSALLENTFPKLERFIGRSRGKSYGDYDDDQIATFISRHPRLKKLDLDRACCILQIIANSCKALEVLAIGMLSDDSCSLQPLQAMTSLKILKLWKANCENLKFLSGLPQLHELLLSLCDKPDDLVGQFAFLNQLTKLHIIAMRGLVASDVVEIIKQLKNLEEFSVDESLDEKTFYRIFGVVKGRPHVLTLKCFFDFNLKNCDENQNVRLLKKDF